MIRWRSGAPSVVDGTLQGTSVSLAMAKAVFDNLAMPSPRSPFTVGSPSSPVCCCLPHLDKKTFSAALCFSHRLLYLYRRSMRILCDVEKVNFEKIYLWLTLMTTEPMA